MYFATDNRIRDVHQSIIDLQSNVMNTKIFTFENIVEALKELKIKDETLRLSIDLEKPNLNDLRELTKYVVMLHGDNLIVVFLVPLKENSLGNVQKFYSIPTMEGEIAKFLDVPNGYVISDKNLDKFVNWEEHKFKTNCKKVGTIFYCKGLMVMSREKESCIYKTLTGYLENIDRTCGIKLLKIHKTVLITTEENNKYLTITANANYGNLITEDERILLEFKGTQMLEINQNAVLKLGHLEVKFFGKNDQIKTQLVNQRRWNLSLENHFDFHSIDIPKIESNVIMKQIEMVDLSESLKYLKDRKDNKNEKEGSVDWIIYAIVGITIGAIAVIISVIVWCFKMKLDKIMSRTNSNVSKKFERTRENKTFPRIKKNGESSSQKHAERKESSGKI